MVKVILILLLLTILTNAFKDCGSRPGSLKSVSILGCRNSGKCKLHKGTNANIEITFTNIKSKKITAVVHGILGGVTPVPFPLPHSDGCLNSGIVCPVTADKIYTYKNSIHVEKMYPPIPVVVKWELKDDRNQTFICVKIPSKIE